MSRLAARIVRLESVAPAGRWRAWVGRPMDDWPDEALLGYLAHACGGAEAAEAFLREVEAKTLADHHPVR